MNLKKLILLLLSLVLLAGMMLSLVSCGGDEHASKFVDENDDDICDICDVSRYPCEGEHPEINSQGYCKVCGYYSDKHPMYEVEHKQHSDMVHGDGMCDMCGVPFTTPSGFVQKLEVFYHSFIEKGGYSEVLKGLLVTVEIAVFGLIIGAILGTLIAVVKVMPKSSRIVKVLEGICDVYVGFFRGTPMVVQLLIGYFVLLPAIFKDGADGVVVAIVIFGLNSGAYVSEIMRAGIQSVDVGQLEAGRAVGLPYSVAMMKIVIPQSIKNILPTLGNEFIVLIKETSVVSFIAVMDITKAFKSIADANYEYLVPYVALALVYLGLVMLIALGIKVIERRLKRNERHG